MGNGKIKKFNALQHIETPPHGPGFSLPLRFFGGFMSLGIATALFTGGLQYGNHTTKVDTALVAIAEKEKTQDTRIEKILEHLHQSDIEQQKLLSTLDVQSKHFETMFNTFFTQQGASDGVFLDVIRDIGRDVKRNSSSINIYHGGKSSLGPTSHSSRYALNQEHQ